MFIACWWNCIQHVKIWASLLRSDRGKDVLCPPDLKLRDYAPTGPNWSTLGPTFNITYSQFGLWVQLSLAIICDYCTQQQEMESIPPKYVQLHLDNWWYCCFKLVSLGPCWPCRLTASASPCWPKNGQVLLASCFVITFSLCYACEPFDVRVHRSSLSGTEPWPVLGSSDLRDHNCARCENTLSYPPWMLWSVTPTCTFYVIRADSYDVGCWWHVWVCIPKYNENHFLSICFWR